MRRSTTPRRPAWPGVWGLRYDVLTVTDVDTSLRRPALAFFAPRNPITGGAPTRFVGRLRGTFVTRAGIWKVFRVTKVGNRRANVCVGS